MPQIAAEVAAAGGVFIIAHPMSVATRSALAVIGATMTCLPGPARLVEVWNGGDWANVESNNEDALALWYVWLNHGHRLVATAGTDAHGPAPDGVRPGFNVVYAETLSEQGILQAIAQGHVFLSDGPQIEFSALTASGVAAIMGDTLPDEPATISACWNGCGVSDRVRLLARWAAVRRTTSWHTGRTAMGSYARAGALVPAGAARGGWESSRGDQSAVTSASGSELANCRADYKALGHTLMLDAAAILMPGCAILTGRLNMCF